MEHITKEQFLLLAKTIIDKGKTDLVSGDERLALGAAKYFFLNPVEGDNHELKTFTGLCVAAGINTDAAAKAIFYQLTPLRQERIRNLLKHAGYNVSKV